MQCALNAWATYAQIATPILVAALGGYFTYHQVVTAKRKLRLDLFDKRFAVFNAARNYLGKAYASGRTEIGDDQKFGIETLGAAFLFEGPEITNYLDELSRRIIDLPFIENEMASAQTEAAKSKFLAERNWLREQHKVLEEIFKRQMQLSG